MTAEKEAEYLFDKNVECPVCDSTFRTRVVKTGRVRRLESDFDLRPRHPDVDTIKYDVVSCPYCGYTALNRFFTDLTRGQKMLIREGVCSKFHPAENGDRDRKRDQKHQIPFRQHTDRKQPENRGQHQHLASDPSGSPFCLRHWRRDLV